MRGGVCAEEFELRSESHSFEDSSSELERKSNNSPSPSRKGERYRYSLMSTSGGEYSSTARPGTPADNRRKT
jgi:hypothetical protein